MLTKLVLIIDDDVDARMIFGAILSYDGYHIVEAIDGEKGVAAAVKHMPSVILMDVMMPVLDGFAAASAIRMYSRTREIPMIAISGNLFTNEEHTRAEILFDGYLLKPVTPTRVLQEVQRLIGPPHE